MRGSKQDLPAAVSLPDGSAIKQIEWGGMSVELGDFNNSADPAPFWIAVPGLLAVALILLIYSGISARQTEIGYGE